jgi:SAM-dependent methyltransferase
MTNLDKNFLEKEFDLLADEYANEHQKNIRITGEKPDYFSEYKIRDLEDYTKSQCFLPRTILDFGCGIGNSIPFFRKYFQYSKLIATDVSYRSIEISKKRFPGKEEYLLIDNSIPIGSETQNLIFSACVFHHIPHEQHLHWLKELYRVASPSAMIVIFEHNPLNPLTVHAVNTCPLDINAKLIRSGQLKKKLIDSGWLDIEIKYKFFFPSFLRVFRPLEKYLSWCFFGGQYQISGSKHIEKIQPDSAGRNKE